MFVVKQLDLFLERKIIFKKIKHVHMGSCKSEYAPRGSDIFMIAFV